MNHECIIHVKELGESPSYGVVYTVWTECRISSMYHCSAALTGDLVMGLIDTLTARADRWSQPYTACCGGVVYPTKRNSDMTPNFDTMTVKTIWHRRD